MICAFGQMPACGAWLLIYEYSLKQNQLYRHFSIEKPVQLVFIIAKYSYPYAFFLFFTTSTAPAMMITAMTTSPAIRAFCHPASS